MTYVLQMWSCWLFNFTQSFSVKMLCREQASAVFAVECHHLKEAGRPVMSLSMGFKQNRENCHS